MSNKVYLGDDGFIHVHPIGDQTYETTKQSVQETAQLIDAIRKQNKPVKILTDLTKMGKQDSGARRGGYEGFMGLDFDKFALLGGGIFLRNVVGLIIKASRLGHKVKVFNRREDVIGWLLS